MMKSFALGLLAAVAVFGSADTGHARPKKPKMIWHCNCTCIAYDDQGGRWEGGKLSFDTTGADCSIGINVKCTVDKGNLDLQGAYASCTGFTKYEKSVTASPSSGVSGPGTNPPPSRSSQLAPAASAFRR